MSIKMTATADLQGAFGATFSTEEVYETKSDAVEALQEWAASGFKPINANAITSITIAFAETTP